MRSAPHSSRGAAADGLRQPQEAFAVLDYALGPAPGSDLGPGHLSQVLGRFATACDGRAALLLRWPPRAEPVVLAAFPASAADPALVAAVGGLLARQPRAACRDGCAEGQLALPRELADSGGPDWAATRPVRVLAACTWPASGPPGGPGAAAAPPAYALVLVAGHPVSRRLRSVARALVSVLAAQHARAEDSAEAAELRAVSLALVEASPDAVVLCDGARRIVRFNPAAERLTGYVAADVIGRDPALLLIPEGYQAEYRSAAASLRARTGHGRPAGRMRMPVLRADGTERMAELTLLPLEVRGESYFCTFLREETDLALATSALAASQERLRLLSALAPVGIAQIDPTGACAFVNERLCVLAGASEEDLLGRSWLQIIHPGDAGRVTDAWSRARAGGVELRTDCRLALPRTAGPGRPADGAAEIWVNAAVTAAPERPGRPDGYLVALTNITARKRAEAERDQLLAGLRAAVRDLSSQTERLNSLIAAAIPGVLLADEQGAIVQLNESLCQLLGITEPPEALAGASAEQLVPAVTRTFADPDRVLELMSGHAARRERARDVQFECADGRMLEIDYWPVLADGRNRGGLWLLWDMSHRVSAEHEREGRLAAEVAARHHAEQARRELSEQNDQLREMDEVRTRFLAQVSHELRTPLSAIVSYAALLRDEETGLTGAGERHLDVIERNAGRMLRMVGDLLLLSRIEAGVIPLELAPVPVPALVTEAASAAEPAAAARGVALQAVLPGGSPALTGHAIQGDRGRLLQVLDNLIGNAVKFTDAGGQVRVSAAPADGGWRVEIADSGIGIPEAELGRLFDRFYRASNARRGGRPGSGLGLAVAMEIVALHGGRIDVTSAEGSGTTVSVWLPTGPEPAPESATEPAVLT